MPNHLDCIWYTLSIAVAQCKAGIHVMLLHPVCRLLKKEVTMDWLGMVERWT